MDAAGAETVSGFAAADFEPVVEEFVRNFRERDDLGAAFAVYRDGELVVDLWGGIADSATGRPCEADTLYSVFSCAKALTATCMAILLDRGLVTLDAPVCAYWPEFATGGKQHVLVRDILGHTAGLPGLATQVTWRDATDDVAMIQLIAAQPLSDDPRAKATYHSLTFGWMCAQLVRRVDGRSIGRFFAEEVAQPLGLELWLGLPHELTSRVATVELGPRWGEAPRFTEEALEADPLLRSVIGNPVRYSPGHAFPWNEPEWQAAEIPGANAIGTARSIARLYGYLGELVGPRTMKLVSTPLSDRHDPLHDARMAFGAGFMLQTPDKPLGPPPLALGHGGAGGSLHGRWPELNIGFSYAMNRLRDDPDDTRATVLLERLHECAKR